MLEAYVALLLFANGEFDKKINCIFRAFDMDNNEVIDRKELLTFL